MMKRWSVWGVICLSVIFRCATVSAQDMPPAFVWPVVPDSVTDFSARGIYAVSHYWDNFAVEDPRYLNAREMVEQAFVDYIAITSVAPWEVSEAALKRLIERASADGDILAMYTDVAGKYLYDPQSQMRSDGIYMMFLEAARSSKLVPKALKLRYDLHYALLNGNREGMTVKDFAFQPTSGGEMRLKKVKSDYVLLFFNDPDCLDCSLMKLRLSVSQKLAREIASGRLTVISIYTGDDLKSWREEVKSYPSEWTNAAWSGGDEQFDLRHLPQLYLLDKKKKVLLRETTIEAVEGALE